MDAEGQLVGAITSQQAMGISENDAEKVVVGKIMIPKKELVIMNANSRADDALKRIYQRNKNRVFVCDNNDYDVMREQDNMPKNSESLAVSSNIILLGIISKSDLLNIASEREEFDRLANR